MSTYSAQGSITIKRLRNGDNFFISLEITNGVPLFQGVDEKTGTASPDWTVPANQPIITPKVTSARGNAVDLSFHSWKYNGVALNFNGAETDGKPILPVSSSSTHQRVHSKSYRTLQARPTVPMIPSHTSVSQLSAV